MQSLSPKRPSKPPWLRVKLPSGPVCDHVKRLIQSKNLHTVCEEARCPNLGECWGCGTATFLILGDSCTRSCRFCSVKHIERFPADHHGDFLLLCSPSGRYSANRQQIVDEQAREAQDLTDAVVAMNLKHVVITSVTRDDLPGGGASAFVQVINCVHVKAPGCTVEVLVPDFGGKRSSVAAVVQATPDIFGHNVETVPRLYPAVRPQARYRRSLSVLAVAKEIDPLVVTKSGFMVGLGENREEVIEVMENLRTVNCDILTIGQYLCPGKEQLPVVPYYEPEEFIAMREVALELGFRWVESGPLVRSSYRAEAQAAALISGKKQRQRGISRP